MGFGILFYKCNLVLIVTTMNFMMGERERAQLLSEVLSKKRTKVRECKEKKQN